MTALVSAANSYSPRLCYVNSAVSNTITNTTTETAFDQVFTLPSQSQRSMQPPSIFRFKCWGIVSTGILNLNTRIRMRLGGVSGTVLLDTGTFGLTGSLSSQGWCAEMSAILTSGGASALFEVQGVGQFSAGLLTVSADQMANASPITWDNTAPQDFVVTTQWSTATANNQIQIRTMCVEIDGP